MKISNDSAYVFDYEYRLACRAIQSAKAGIPVDVLVCLEKDWRVPLKQRNVPSFKGKGVLRDGWFHITFEDDLGKQEFEHDYSAMLQEIERRYPEN